jgi:hypothetical protein
MQAPKGLWKNRMRNDCPSTFDVARSGMRIDRRRTFGKIFLHACAAANRRMKSSSPPEKAWIVVQGDASAPMPRAARIRPCRRSPKTQA